MRVRVYEAPCEATHLHPRTLAPSPSPLTVNIALALTLALALALALPLPLSLSLSLSLTLTLGESAHYTPPYDKPSFSLPAHGRLLLLEGEHQLACNTLPPIPLPATTLPATTLPATTLPAGDIDIHTTQRTSGGGGGGGGGGDGDGREALSTSYVMVATRGGCSFRDKAIYAQQGQLVSKFY